MRKLILDAVAGTAFQLGVKKMTIAPVQDFDYLRSSIHADNVAAGWWTNILTGESILDTRNMGELLMLCVSEVSEAHEGHDNVLKDDKLPHRDMVEVELADTGIRLFDIAGARNVPLAYQCYALLDGGTRYSVEDTVDTGLLQIVNALSRAMEGDRKSNKEKFERGIAEAVLRVYELGHDLGYDVAGAIQEKRSFNRSRADHKVENRLKEGGKRY